MSHSTAPDLTPHQASLTPPQTRRKLQLPTTPAPNLAKQRLNRPVSPHLSIYRPNMALYGSGFNRITAVTLAGSLYLAGLAYLAAPVFGYHVDTQSMVAVVAGWPAGVKYGIKGFFAFPFFYHGLNGLRHLAWDVGVGFQNKTVVRTGWGVVGASVVGTVYFVLWG